MMHTTAKSNSNPLQPLVNFSTSNPVTIARTALQGVAKVSLAQQFQDSITREFTELSGIANGLFSTAAEFISDQDTSYGDVSFPIARFLGWDERKSKPSDGNKYAVALYNECGKPFQLKGNWENAKGRKYHTPKGSEDSYCAAYLPPLDSMTRSLIGHSSPALAASDARFWDVVESDPTIPIVITEGAKKGLAGLTAGFVTIALYGVDAGASKKVTGVSTLIPDLERFACEGRTFIIAFDRDTQESTVTRVSAATQNLARLLKLEAEGITVKVARWGANEGKGLDDLLVSKGREALANAFREAQEVSREGDRDEWLATLGKPISKLIKAISRMKEGKDGEDSYPVLKGLASDHSKAFMSYFNGDVAYRLSTGEFLHYQNGLWSPMFDIEIESMIVTGLDLAGVSYLPAVLENCLKLLRTGLYKRDWTQARAMVPFLNGVLNLEKGEFSAHVRSSLFTWQLPYDYSPEATCTPVVDWLLWTMEGHEDRVLQLQAWTRSILGGDNRAQKILILKGDGRCGKSTFSNLLTLAIGGHNSASLGFKDLETDKYVGSRIAGKRLVLIPEAGKWGGSVEMVKKMLGQDPIAVERKYKQCEGDIRFEGVMVAISNEYLRVTDSSSGWTSKPAYMPFNRVVPEGERRDLLSEFKPMLPGFFNWAMQMSADEALHIIQNAQSYSPSLDEARMEAMVSGNPLLDWLSSEVIFEPSAQSLVGAKHSDGGGLLNVGVDLYPSYCHWCSGQGVSAMAAAKFGVTIVDLCRNTLGKQVEKTRVAKGIALRGMRVKPNLA